MKFSQIYVRSFGKLRDFSLGFSDGINLICGQNEAGKSTLHNFIYGSLFGFVRHEKRRRMLTTDYHKYRPWQGEEYEGTIVLTADGREYRCERDFAAHSIKVYDNITGEDLTAGFSVSSRTKELMFCQQIWQLSPFNFKNTLCFSHRRDGFEDEFATEVTMRLTQLQPSDSDSESIAAARHVLAKEIDTLGSERAYTKPIGKLHQEISELKFEFERVEQQQENMRHLQQQLQNLKGQERTLSDRLASEEGILRQIQASQISYKISAARVQQAKLTEFEAQMHELHKYATVDETHAEDIAEMQRKIGEQCSVIAVLKQEAEGRCAKWKLSQEKLSEKGKIAAITTDEYEKVATLALRYEELRRTGDRLAARRAVVLDGLVAIDEILEPFRVFETQNPLLHIEQLESAAEKIDLLGFEERCDQLGKMIEARKVGRPNYLASAGLAVVILVGALVVVPFAALLLVVPALLAWQESKRAKTNRGEIQRLKQRLAQLQAQSEQAESELNRIEDEIYVILGSCNVKSKNELQQEYARYQVLCQERLKTQLTIQEIDDSITDNDKVTEHTFADICRVLSEYGYRLEKTNSSDALNEFLNTTDCVLSLKRQLAESRNDCNACKDKVSKAQQELQLLKQKQLLLLQNLGFSTFEAYAEACKYKHTFVKIDQERNHVKAILTQVLENKTISEWEQELDSLGAEMKLVEESIDSETFELVRRRCFQLNQERSSMREQIAGVTSELETMCRNIRPLTEIEEELSEKRQQLDILFMQKRALAQASELLQEVAEDIHREFAPICNNKVAEYLQVLTGGRYHDARLSRELEVSLVSPDTRKQVSASALSCGTEDQVYLATRLALADVINDRNDLPLILDDVFVHYDNIRLRFALELLVNLAFRRQILLFTCHNREKEILKEMGYQCNVIDLH